MKPITLVVLICSLQCYVHSYKILVITSMPSHSHFTVAFSLARELAAREHQVTFINPYPQKTPIKNLRDVSLEDTKPFVEEMRKTFLHIGSGGYLNYLNAEHTLGAGVTEYALNNTNVQKLLNSEESFDVVIIEHFQNEALVSIGHHFKAPIIFLAPVPPCMKNNYLTGNPAPESYVPDLLGTYTKHMNFWQRLNNFRTTNIYHLYRELVILPKHRELFEKYSTGDVELDDVLYNVSLVLTFSHPSVTDAIPLLPNIIEIGGYHVPPAKKLPEDLQIFLDNAKEGVVLFAMGSNLKSKDLSIDTRKAILNSFGKLKEKVLWKFETDLPEAPENVKIMKWLPQQDILAHPNVRAFITHGGLLSAIETIHYGVPIIGIPVFGDQKYNVASAVEAGYALKVSLDELTEEKFSWALDEILHNPKYRENAQRRSRIMHDQPLKPIDSAVYWIDHVIRHKGAPHLRSAGIDLKWYQRGMLDIYAFLVACVVIFWTITYIILKKIVRKLFISEKKIIKNNVASSRKNK